MGSATITAGNTYVDVLHGLSFTPTIDQIQLTPQDALGGRSFWPSNPGATTFRINIDMMDPDVSHTFSWQPIGTGAPITPAGAFPIAASDVQVALNATYDSVNHVYNVYGLKIADTTLAAYVTFANNYILSILGVPSLATTDPNYPVAYNCALDIACIRVLVVSMGGSLVGAFDYFLGDLRVARAGPYKEAITATLQGFKDDLSRQLVNLTPVAVTFDVQAKGEVPTYRGDLASP
jgi:hypothetical protein